MAGVPKEGQFSILHKPWFDLEIFHRFRRGDFKPKPKVKSVMFRIRKKEEPLIDKRDAGLFKLLVKQGYSFRLSNKPSDLSLDQWLAVFEFLRQRVLV